MKDRVPVLGSSPPCSLSSALGREMMVQLVAIHFLYWNQIPMLSSGKKFDNSYFGQYYVTSMCSKSILSATVYQASIELWQTSCCRSYGYYQKHNPMIKLKLAGQQAKQTCIRHHSWSDRPYYGTQSTSLLRPFRIILESFLFFHHDLFSVF